jgi:hypothetical protein
MLPVGYMYKKVVTNPDWIKTDQVEDIYSLSGHVSEDFADYINYWKHNGYWLFDSPETLQEVANNAGIDLSCMTLFYYEVYEKEFDEETRQWLEFSAETAFTTNVRQPEVKNLQGYDVATFTCHTSPECSPLSCNSLAEEVRVNQHCLFRTFEEAKESLENGIFNNSEPGPFRIFAVYTLPIA